MPKINLPNLYSQWDTRWANILLGFNSDPKFNIYNYGCLITCLAMVARYYKKETDPENVNTTLKSINGYVGGSGNYVYGSFTKVYGDIKEKRTTTPLPLTDGQLGEIRGAIDAGYPVMLQIDVNPRTVALDMHFVLCIGYNPADENDLIIADPLGGKERSLKDYLGWYKPSVRNTIESYLIYEGNVPKDNTNTICLSKDDANKRTHNSEQWIKTVGYLGIEGDPTFTDFEAAQAVIAGIKSTNTSLKSQLEKANGDLSAKTQEVTNLNKQVSTLKDEALKAEKDYKARIDEIIKAQPDISKITGQYEGEIKVLKGKLEVAETEAGNLKIELAKCQGTQEDIKDAQNAVAKLWEFVRKYFMLNVFKKNQ